MDKLAVVLIGIILVSGVITWNVYKFKECKKVGHATMYCVLTTGGK